MEDWGKELLRDQEKLPEDVSSCLDAGNTAKGLVPSSVKVLGKQMSISTKFDSGSLGPYFSKVLKSHLHAAKVLDQV